MSEREVLVLDSLFDTLDVEQQVAQSLGWTARRWDGAEGSLHAARVVVHVRTPVDAALIGRMPECRVIGRFGTGLDSVDLEAAAAAGIAVVNVRDYCIPEMASHTLGLAFALERRLADGWDDPAWREADWQAVAQRRPIPGRTAAAVIGFGSIGSAVAKALHALRLRVLVVTRHAAEAVARLGMKTASLGDALHEGDFVFLHASLDSSTAGLMNHERLSMVRPGAILVNTARLSLLDEDAVTDALETGQLGGLGLDARLPRESPLRHFAGDPRVLITPHIGWYSRRSAQALREQTIRRSIEAFQRSHSVNLPPP
ncbi:MAG TPA: NAD(P)-dependent oxidoreductase, partial [Candidatus Sulfotelmatobacter sp.]|nr:NAD(P)-dependent oxidoreductase [Candidatus Sulfotelmatobacter sp.]